MKNFMVLGASILQIPLIHQARKIGYAPVVVSPHEHDPGFEYAAQAVYADVRDEKTILAQAQKYDIAGIATDQTDLPVTTAAYVAEQMGLPGIGYETARLFTNKYLMREKCRALGLKTPAYRIVNSPSEAKAFFDSLNPGTAANPAIIKPADNQGSRGISKVTFRKEIEETFNSARHWSASNAVLMEQHITGREFLVEGMASDYTFSNLALGDTYYFNAPDTFTPASRIFPSTADDAIKNRILELNTTIITGFGLKSGITHSEYIMTEDGDIYLIETAARGGGMFISSDIIPLLTDINTEEFLIRIATGTLAAAPTIKRTGLACCYISCVLPAGEVISVKGVEEINSMPYICGHNLNAIYAGMKTKAFTDKTTRYFTVLFADDHDGLARRIEKIKKTLQVEIKTNNGIQSAIWE